jgi:hypothetical protein
VCTFLPWMALSSARMVKYFAPPILRPLLNMESLLSNPLQMAVTSGPLNYAGQSLLMDDGRYLKSRGYCPGTVSCLGVNGSLIDGACSNERGVNVRYVKSVTKAVKMRYEDGTLPRHGSCDGAVDGLIRCI